MIGASFMGILGVVFILMLYIIKGCSLTSFGVPYLTPFSPISITGIKNSIIKFSTNSLNNRENYLSKNKIRFRRLR